MKEISLTKGQFALVDDDDYDFLMQWKWHALEVKDTYYAVRSSRISDWVGKRMKILMHRVITKAPKEKEVDHRDHNGLNNKKENLRLCTHSQNAMNNRRGGVSPYRGVSYNALGSIQCQIRIDGNVIYLGHHKTEISAALTYDKKALELFGEFANLNFPELYEKK